MRLNPSPRFFAPPQPFPQTPSEPPRQRAAEQRFPGVATPMLLGSVLIVGVLAAVLRLAMHGPVQLPVALAFGAVIVVGEAMRVTLPGGRDNAPLAATAALGYALTVTIGGQPARWGPVQVIVVVAVAAALGAVPQAIAGRPAPVGYLVRRIAVTGVIAWLSRSLLATTMTSASHIQLLLLLCAMVTLALILDSGLAAIFATSAGRYADGSLIPTPEYPETTSAATGVGVAGGGAMPGQRGEDGSSLRIMRSLFAVWVNECVAVARVCPAIGALTVAVALAAGPLGLWVLPIAAAPILVMQRALRRYAAVRATYQQTIRALSRMTDIAGYTDPGHARRVCRLALAIGRDLSLSEPELLDLEYAALLHDIGQLSLADPLPGGATVLATPWVAADVAARGAEVVRQTGVLDRVARVLEAQPLAYNVRVEEPAGQSESSADGDDGGDGESSGRQPADESERRAAAILRVANDFEDLRTADPGPSAHVKALARIRRGIGDPYYPCAVESLTRLVSVE